MSKGKIGRRVERRKWAECRQRKSAEERREQRAREERLRREVPLALASRADLVQVIGRYLDSCLAEHSQGRPGSLRGLGEVGLAIEREARNAAGVAGRRGEWHRPPDPERRSRLERRVERLRRLIRPSLQRAPELLSAPGYALGLWNLTHLEWLRDPRGWRPRTKATARRFGELARHLLARYWLPAVFDGALLAHESEHGLHAAFAEVARGGRLRDLVREGRLTPRLGRKQIALLFAARGRPEFLPQLRRIQALAAGCRPAIAEALARGRWGRHTFVVGWEEFVAHAVDWMARQPELRARELDPVLDFLVARRREDPSYSLRGRTARSVRRACDEWHRAHDWRAVPKDDPLPRSGLEPGLWHIGDSIWELVEFRTPRELWREGRRMHHCVASYVQDVLDGDCWIFSLRRMREGDSRVEHVLTVEVSKDRRIETALGLLNRPATRAELEILRRWAVANGLILRKGAGVLFA